jgi:hypothetical protein
MRALDESKQLSGDNKTDCVNRALQVYAVFLKVTEAGGELQVKQNGQEAPERIILL